MLDGDEKRDHFTLTMLHFTQCPSTMLSQLRIAIACASEKKQAMATLTDKFSRHGSKTVALLNVHLFFD
jgi:hypothetical protein